MREARGGADFRGSSGPAGSGESLAPALGRGGDRSDRTQRFPRQFDKSLSRDRVGLLKISDFRKANENRIAPLDVRRLLARTGTGEGEENGITGGQRVAWWQRHDRPARSTPLDFRDPLVVGRKSHQDKPRIIVALLS